MNDYNVIILRFGSKMEVVGGGGGGGVTATTADVDATTENLNRRANSVVPSKYGIYTIIEFIIGERKFPYWSAQNL